MTNASELLRRRDKELESPLSNTSTRRNTDTQSAEDENSSNLQNIPSICSQISTCSHGAKLVRDWTTENVCQFVESIESCKQYVEVRINKLTVFSRGYTFSKSPIVIYLQ